MDIKQWARWLANKLIGVLWFIVRNPFLIIKRVIRWTLIAVFWLFLLGWGISAFAAEWVPAPTKQVYAEKGNCYEPNGSYAVGGGTNVTVVQCYTYRLNQCKTAYGATCFVQEEDLGSRLRLHIKHPTKGEWTYQDFVAQKITSYFCPPTDKPDFTVGPKILNGQQVCEKMPITCKMGEVKAVASNGAESCKENCASVAGQGIADAAYNQAFLPSATVTCYGSCSVISQGTTVVLPANGFTMHGDIQFTGDKCPVTFPETGDGQPVYNDQPESSDETNAAQDQLQNAASNATSTDNAISGATGTADLNQVVDKIAEASNAQIKAMSEQNAAMGKVIEGVGKDIQGAIKQSGGGGSGASMGQLATANAIKEGNATLQEISDKLDEQQNPEPPVKPGTDLAADASGIHESNDWGQRNFGTVLTANAERFKALPVFSLPSTFFNANIAGGSCPSYTGSFTLFGTSFDVSFDAFCSQTVMSVMPYIRAVVMMLFGWLAWRIAIGNGG
ncbi:hypothetical protein ACTG22_06345 [Aeromonas caviae]|uniref:hypothetical protein n=1 Tax=Aeromonas caviae TaxID=648 RepID=UPI0030B1BDBE